MAQNIGRYYRPIYFIFDKIMVDIIVHCSHISGRIMVDNIDDYSAKISYLLLDSIDH